MSAEKSEHKERVIIPTKFSVSILAETGAGYSFQRAKVLLVRNTASKKWGLPAGGTIYKPDGKLESPIESIRREWDEETGGLPFQFKYPPFNLDTIILPEKELAHVGIIFKTTLMDELADRIGKGIRVTGHETDYVRLFKYRELVYLLENWRQRIHKPEYNSDLLLNWCNNLSSGHDDLFLPGGESENIKRGEFGITWPIYHVSQQGLNEKEEEEE